VSIIDNGGRETIRFIDLFGGVGGFHLGLQRASNIIQQNEGRKHKLSQQGGEHSEHSERTVRKPKPVFRCVFYSDIDKYAVKTYNKNFGTNYKPTDIRNVKADSIPEFDLLCAGFPCQAFSIAGKRKGFEDTRGTLFFEICRLLESKRPRLCLLENVKGLLNHDEGKTFGIILQSLDELGYDVEWQVLNSKHFCVPQNRERVFIIGHFRGSGGRKVFPITKNNRKVVKLQGQPAIVNTIQAGYERNRQQSYIIEGSEPSQEKATIVHNIYGGFGEGVREFDNISPTIRTPKGGGHLPMVMLKTNTKQGYDVPRDRKDGIRLEFPESKTARGRVIKDATPALKTGGTEGVLDNRRIRRLTPIECERLQGFPDNWTKGVSDTQRYKQMGNAVTVNVIEAIGRRIISLHR
jgi:DNA (cytosine-5)-methyltransferase 1